MAAMLASVEQQLKEKETLRQEEKFKRHLDKKRLYVVIEDLRTNRRDQTIIFFNERHNFENAWEMEREILKEKSAGLQSELTFRQAIYDAKLESEQRKRDEEKKKSAVENEYLLEITDAYRMLLQESQSDHPKELRQKEDEYEENLNDQDKAHNVIVDDLHTRQQNIEKRLDEEIKHHERSMVELQRKLEWQRKGTDSWVAIMKRHHMLEMDDMKQKPDIYECELSLVKCTNRELQNVHFGEQAQGRN
jgi:hypothetical protein